MLGGTHTAALVGDDGSVDWLCFPRFDSGAVFASLLGDPSNGRWLIAPHASPGESPHLMSRRQYRGGSMVLETEFRTATGRIRIVDALVHGGSHGQDVNQPTLIRQVEGLEGHVEMTMELRLRFDYGRVVPWVRRAGNALLAIAGPDAVALRTPVELQGSGAGRDAATTARFTVSAGQRVPFALSWHPSHEHPRLGALDADALLAGTTQWWEEWLATCTYSGRYDDAVRRSLTVLKALTYEPTGGIVAAPTTSLPEALKRFAQLGLPLLLAPRRHHHPASAALRCGCFDGRGRKPGGSGCCARSPATSATCRSCTASLASDARRSSRGPGSARLRGIARRVGSATPRRASSSSTSTARCSTRSYSRSARRGARSMRSPTSPGRCSADAGLPRGQPGRSPTRLWEVRGGRQHFVHSKVMCWVGLRPDAVRGVEQFGHRVRSPIDARAGRWPAGRRPDRDPRRGAADRGFDGAERGTFTQSYGSSELDAAVRC